MRIRLEAEHVEFIIIELVVLRCILDKCDSVRTTGRSPFSRANKCHELERRHHEVLE